MSKAHAPDPGPLRQLKIRHSHRSRWPLKYDVASKTQLKMRGIQQPSYQGLGIPNCETPTSPPRVSARAANLRPRAADAQRRPRNTGPSPSTRHKHRRSRISDHGNVTAPDRSPRARGHRSWVTGVGTRSQYTVAQRWSESPQQCGQTQRSPVPTVLPEAAT